jgi:hypothetical protein
MNTAETLFTDEQAEALQQAVDMIIPASIEHGLPGAGDPVIFADILATASAQYEATSTALAALDSVAHDRQDAGFAALAPDARDAAATAFRQSHPGEAELLATITVQCYYRDDRVMRSLNMEARAPHPAGYTVDQGDWSLLEPVQHRPEFFRKAP